MTGKVLINRPTKGQNLQINENVYFSPNNYWGTRNTLITKQAPIKKLNK